jgi:hypothetical protein
MTTTNQPMFQPDSQTAARFATALSAGMTAALDRGWSVLEAWGQEYKSRVERITPVARGVARQSWFLTAERTSNSMTMTLSNRARSTSGGQPYPFYLEFGTDRIAGGQLKAWQPGDAPVTAWPAKTLEPPVAPRFGGQASERHVDVLSHAFSADSEAQMPMLRPIGYELAPQMIAAVQHALAAGFQSVAPSKSGGD